MKFLLEINIDKLDRDRADYQLAELLEQVAQQCRDLELEDGQVVHIADDNGKLVGLYAVSSEHDEEEPRAENVDFSLLALVRRLANPDQGELLTLADYRQIAQTEMRRLGLDA